LTMRTPISLLADLEPRQDATARLLLMLSRAELTADQQVQVRKLAVDVKDWDEFVDIAARKFVATFASRHLSSFAADIVPAPALARLRGLARSVVMATLRIAAAQAAFHRDCIAPSSAQHAYMKGVALSRQVLGDIGQRYCRDIDVLVAARHFEPVMVAAVRAGYKLLLGEDFIETSARSSEFRFVAKHADVATLLGPDQIPIEVHRRLDKMSLKFDLQLALRTAEEIEIGGVPMKALPRRFHFVYACYHHSRHFWSHLHWLADLDGFARDPDCGREGVLALAEQVGLRPTIEAALEFRELAATPERWEDALQLQAGGGQFLKACLVNLDGDLKLEESLRGGMLLNDFMSAWQVERGSYQRLWFNSWLRRMRPSVSQYMAHQRPAFLHWTYSVDNTVALLRNGVELASAAIVRSSGALAQRFRRPKNVSR
jgi:hypothetical protein